MINCPFCMPNIETACFAESTNFRAIYNRAPIVPGHVLIIPKNHIVSFLEISDNLMIEYVIFSRKIIKVLQKAFSAESYNWTIQEGEPAGQTIEHMHMHIIPRFENDLPQPGDWYPILIEKTDEIIDSFSRKRITSTEILEIVSYLKHTANQTED